MEENGKGCLGIIVTCIIIIVSNYVTSLTYERKPKAIEVYQGKTTLEYKIIDGEIIDSCVVYKNK